MRGAKQTLRSVLYSLQRGFKRHSLMTTPSCKNTTDSAQSCKDATGPAQSCSNATGSTKTLFLEIFSEEIPANKQQRACEGAKEAWRGIFAEEHLEPKSITVGCVSRRLWGRMDGIAEATPAIQVEKRGPRVGAPEAAVQGFLKSLSLDRKDVEERDGYLYATITQPGQAFVDRIPALVQKFVRIMPWAKSMRWAVPNTGEKSDPWIRPVRSVLCLWGDQPVTFDLPGWGLQTGNTTRGHRFLTPEAFEIHSADAYEATLREHFVLADPSERRQKLEQAAQEKLSALGLHLQPDEGLWQEVTGLVDWPFVVIGQIESEFMTLPEAVLATSMRVHQKYFATRDAHGHLAPYFVAFSNVPDTSAETIRHGFEKVLRARLSDAAFFYREDLKQPLEANAPKLDAIVFHEKLGTLGQKVARMAVVAPNLERCAKLCKLDLVSHMVGEFDELQGTMGALYARQQGEDAAVAQAIGEHYKPAGASDDLPSTPLGRQLAVLDRLDTLVGFLGVGIAPSGSKDPFALRRAALGILRIVLQDDSWELEQWIAADREAYATQGVPLSADLEKVLRTFLYERLAVLWKDVFRYDVIQSALAFGELSGASFNFYDLQLRAQTLQRMLPTESWTDLLAQHTRLIGLAKPCDLEVNSKLFEDASEKALWSEYERLAPQFHAHLENREYEAALKLLATARGAVDTFLDRVKISVGPAELCANRQALLASFLGLFRSVARFEKIQTVA